MVAGRQRNRKGPAKHVHAGGGGGFRAKSNSQWQAWHYGTRVVASAADVEEAAVLQSTMLKKGKKGKKERYKDKHMMPPKGFMEALIRLSNLRCGPRRRPAGCSGALVMAGQSKPRGAWFSSPVGDARRRLLASVGAISTGKPPKFTG